MNAPHLPPGILNGIRILDFTWKTVGPWAPRLLTHFGAEVIHVERAGSWDDHRYTLHRSPIIEGPPTAYQSADATGPMHGGGRLDATKKYYAEPYFTTLHHGKLAISLNTRHPKGLALAEKLIGISDAMVENFSGEVLPSWGLTWERIHELNRRLVYMSTSGFGHSGEWKAFRSFGPTAQAQSGLTLCSGLPGMPPAGWGFSYMDVTGGWMGGLALIMGLLEAKKTGEGFYIDYAVTEGAMALLGTYMLDYQVNGRTTRRPGWPPGNRSVFPAVAPHNTYRCAGKDRVGQDWWVFIACETQEQFESLARLMDRPDLCQDARFATNQARVVNQDELDAIIGRWTRPRRRYDVMMKCQQAGIIAAAVQSAEDRVEYDPQLKHRGMHPVIDHPEIGEFEYEGYPVQLSRTPAHVHGRGPMLKEHNRYVFGELLGLSDDEMTSLESEKVI
ncbi:MAG: carnitine dehydratase [Candidatus Rokuibacteriota bacterium]|nr:MAG: carnitine dehydratase [Candidatus Rokubacteria bacterium]